MVTLLRRLFIKDYRNVRNDPVRTAHGILAASWGLFTNALLVALKVTVAILLAANSGWVFSIALIAEAANNLSDFGSSLVTLIGFSAARKPADKEHPFGHRKVEYVAGLTVAIFVLVAAVELFIQSLTKAIGGETVIYDALALSILGASALLKVLQGYVNIELAKIIASPALKATAKDSFLDAFATTLVFVGGIFGLVYSLGFLDAYLGLGVSLFVGYSGVRMIIEEANPLIGVPNDPKSVETIKGVALAHPEVDSVHDVMIHEYGPGVNYVSLHLVVDEAMSLSAAHEVADAVEAEIYASLGYHATAHIDPAPLSDKKREAMERRVADILSSFGEGVSFHDLRLERHEGKETLELDVLVPFGFKEEEAVREALSSLAKATRITFDHE